MRSLHPVTSHLVPIILLINSTNVMYFLHVPNIQQIENFNFTQASYCSIIEAIRQAEFRSGSGGYTSGVNSMTSLYMLRVNLDPNPSTNLVSPLRGDTE